ncbi:MULTISPECIES: DUF4178 domain-containing protein [unclassified Arcicella]|uniref:DUF4178 domain-containing protein n=1 Tax=unclassified Arcicella TaxID=2644986 RepID=UPI002866B122|nr:MULTISPECIES: DUF4178 domain-containing protein [unclassified Arcicella]MDR6561598.1 hypothetical protein [Arcicella sp. BE51]MDR6812378.1 hypothetical protein [Arcicella sp. BE140]MDR6823850.1 hypothetical protein [Arcicella sp. BE139]
MKLSVNQLFHFSQDYQCASCLTLLRVNCADTQCLVCNSCGTLHVVKKSNLYDGQYKVDEIHNHKYPQGAKSTISIGTKLKLKEIDFTVVGFLKKKEGSYAWQEYYLYNEKEGYYFLTEYKGHWTFLKESTDANINTYKIEITFEHQNYRLFSEYHANIKGALGEFPIDLLEVSSTSVKEYINPPYLLTVEKHRKKITWFKGEHLPSIELYEALGEKVELPKEDGIGVIQPSSFSVSFVELMKIAVIALTLLVIIQVFFSPSERVYSKDFNVFSIEEMRPNSEYDSTKFYITPSFKLKGGNRNIEFTLRADVSNNWFETDLVLVNEKTGEEYTTNLGVEYYSGVEGGESWSEGSTEMSTLLEKIPEGTYHLEITPSSAYPSIVSDFSIIVDSGVADIYNFFIVLVCIAIIPAYSFYIERNFEKSRWDSSEYSPYLENN